MIKMSASIWQKCNAHEQQLDIPKIDEISTSCIPCTGILQCIVLHKDFG